MTLFGYQVVERILELNVIIDLALGSDFDGKVKTPFNTAHLVELTQGLLENDFTPREIEQIMGQNVLRVFEQALPKE